MNGERGVLWRPTPSSWLPPCEWTYPQCSATVITGDASPRCGRCGFIENGS